MSEEQKSLDQFEKDPSEQTSDKRDTSLGRLPVEWVVRSLGEDFAIEYGNEKPEKELQTDGFPVYGANGIIGYGNEYLFDEPVVSVTCRGATCGNVHLTQPQSWVTNNSLVLTGGGKINKRYLLDSLRYHSVERAISGSAQSQITATMLSKMDYCAPSLPEQRKIATVLHNVDQAIQKTEEIIESLQEIRTGLTQDLLIQGIEQQELVETRVGPISLKFPSHWSVLTVDDITDTIYRYPTYQNIDYVDDGVPEVRVGMLQGDGTVERGNEKYISKSTSEEYPQTELNHGDTLMAVRGATLGKIGFVPEWLDGGNINPNLIRISSGDNILDRYLTELFMSGLVQRQIESYSYQTTVKTITSRDIRRIAVPVPPIDEQKEIVNILEGVSSRIKNEQECAYLLNRLKQGLMQDLLSGTVRTTNTNIEVPDEITQHG